MNRRRVAAALVAATATLVAGCSADEYVAPTPTQQAEVADPAAAAATLAILEDALTDRDPAAARALGADEAAAELLAALVDNAAALDLDQVAIEYVTETGRTDGPDGWDGVVSVAWRFSGLDDAAARVELPVGFAAGGTRIAAVGEGAGRLPIWLGGPVRARSVQNGLVLVADPSADLGAWARWARRAVAATDGLGEAGQEAPGLVVEVPADGAGLHRALGVDDGDYASIAAITAPVDGTRAPGSPVHVFVNPPVFDDLDPTAAQVVVTHEAVHARTGAVLATSAPLWLVEGFADHVALRDVDLPIATTAGQVLDRVRSDGVPGQLPPDADFAADGRHLGAAYEAAWQVTETLAERGGEAALLTLYRDVLADGDLASALRSGFGWDVADLTAAWQARLGRLAGVAG